MADWQAGKYRKRPVVIEAGQFPGVANVPNKALLAGDWSGLEEAVDATIAFEDWLEPFAKKADRWPLLYRGQSLIIPSLEGDMEAQPGDWIIVGVQDEIYPCKPDIFKATYEPETSTPKSVEA